MALPGIGQWVAPTLDPAELEKRISELKTVQFWLEQNAKMLAATIQALEVQRMTLATLKTMNVQMGDLRESLKAKVPDTSEGTGAGAAEPASKRSGKTATLPGSVVDPMQWWGALTNQFAQLATAAMKDGGGDAAGAMLKQSLDTATAAFKTASSVKPPARPRAKKRSAAKAR